MPKRTRVILHGYEKKDTHRCVWCDEPFETNHGNATTCSGRCRSRLKWFRDRCGFDPYRPPGNITAHAAYLTLIAELVAHERRRRFNKQTPTTTY